MFLKHRQDIKEALQSIDPEPVYAAVEILQSIRETKGVVYVLGNGGSASTASHLANDLLKACGIRAYSLPDMTSVITAFGNDCSWEEMYSRTLASLLSPSDVLVAISCSGNSPNVVDPVRMMKYNPQVRTIALVGDNLECGVARARPDVLISVPFPDIRVQEDCHLMICHAMVRTLCDATPTPQGVL